MRLIAVDTILTVTEDVLPKDALGHWTHSVAVAAAATRKQGYLPPIGVQKILPSLGWVVVGSSEKNSYPVAELPDALSMPKIELLDVFLNTLKKPVPSDVYDLLESLWNNSTDATDHVIGIAVANKSDEQTTVELRSLCVPALRWGWVADPNSLQGTIIRSCFMLNFDVYKQVADTVEKKYKKLADRTHFASLAPSG